MQPDFHKQDFHKQDSKKPNENIELNTKLYFTLKWRPTQESNKSVMDMDTTEPDISEEEEIEEEEMLVHADFDTVIDESMFQKDSLFKVIGLNADEPFLQIGTQMYSGKWYDSVGTYLFFEPEPAPPLSDPVFSDTPTTLLNYKFKTRKCLELSRVFINSKNKEENDSLSLSKEGDNTEKPTTSQDSLKDS